MNAVWDTDSDISPVRGSIFNDSPNTATNLIVRWLGSSDTLPDVVYGDVMWVAPQPSYRSVVQTFDLGLHNVSGLNPEVDAIICVDFEDVYGDAWRLFPSGALRLRREADIDLL